MKLINQQMVELLQTAYRMEVETVMNYLANSIFLDGVAAMEIKRALEKDVPEELNHARMLGHRIKQMGGRIPGALEMSFDQQSLLPPEDPLNVDSVIHGVVEAERSAIQHYREIIHQTADSDPVTADLATRILAEEEEHRTLFEGFEMARSVQSER